MRTRCRPANGVQLLPGEAKQGQECGSWQTAHSPLDSCLGSVADPTPAGPQTGAGLQRRLRCSPQRLRAAAACMPPQSPIARHAVGREIQLRPSLPRRPRVQGLCRGWHSPPGCKSPRPGMPLTLQAQGRQLLRPPPSNSMLTSDSCCRTPTQGPLQQACSWARRHHSRAPPRGSLALRMPHGHGR